MPPSGGLVYTSGLVYEAAVGCSCIRQSGTFRTDGDTITFTPYVCEAHCGDQSIENVMRAACEHGLGKPSAVTFNETGQDTWSNDWGETIVKRSCTVCSGAMSHGLSAITYLSILIVLVNGGLF